jgi:hypothetical protein
MSFAMFTISEDGSDDDDERGRIQFSNIIEEEEYEQEPEAFQGFQK